VATRITLSDGLADQDTTDLSSPASCGSARYARLTARRIYYGTFNHDICQHTRHKDLLATEGTKLLAESRFCGTESTEVFDADLQLLISDLVKKQNIPFFPSTEAKTYRFIIPFVW
jgi:hypothetical protein